MKSSRLPSHVDMGLVPDVSKTVFASIVRDWCDVCHSGTYIYTYRMALGWSTLGQPRATSCVPDDGDGSLRNFGYQLHIDMADRLRRHLCIQSP
jgi:hypothetical protein